MTSAVVTRSLAEGPLGAILVAARPPIAVPDGAVSADLTSTVSGGNLLVAVVIALAAGLVSFASPCVLPLVPGFLGYVTGATGVPLDQQRRSRVMTGALLFVLGFSLVFMTMILLATALGTALREHQGIVMRVGGVIVILLGLVFLGVGSGRSFQPSWRPAAGLAGAPLLGVVFALGWAPCNGPTLGAIMMLASTDSALTRGIVLGLAYCLGLGVPFLLLAAGWDRAGRASAWLRGHYRAVQIIGGVLLIAMGLLLVTGLWDELVRRLQISLIGPFETVL